MTPIPDRQGSGSAMRLDMRRGAPELVATQGGRCTAPFLHLVRLSRSHSLLAITTGAYGKILRSRWSGRQGALCCNFPRQQLRGCRWSRARGNSRIREDVCQKRPPCQSALPGLAAGQETVVSCAARLCQVILMFWKVLVQEVFIREAESAVCFPVPLTCDACAV